MFFPLEQGAMKSNWGVSVGVGVGSVALVGWWAWRRYAHSDLPTEWEEVGRVSKLVVYPLKSAGGISVEHAEATLYGFTHGHAKDRTLLVVDEGGRFITGRQAPKLPTVTVSFSGATVTLGASDAPSLSLDLLKVVAEKQILDAIVFAAAVQGYDCGDEAARWLTQVLHGEDGPPLRLLYNHDLTTYRGARKPQYYEFKQFKSTDRVVYADTCAYMLSTESSLRDLNTRLASPVTMDWFRSNIIVSGSKPYDEDDWAFVKLGDVVLRRLKLCDRCIFTNVDPVKGAQTPDQEPMTTLKKYRLVSEPESVARAQASKPIFGSHLGISKCGSVRVGDVVMVARASTNTSWSW